MDSKIDVIYCRYSSELQRSERNTDQERRCRDHLDRRGVPHAPFQVIADEAISGTLESRPGVRPPQGADLFRPSYVNTISRQL